MSTSRYQHAATVNSPSVKPCFLQHTPMARPLGMHTLMGSEHVQQHHRSADRLDGERGSL